MNKNNLPGFNGSSAYSGGIRFHDVGDMSWRELWGRYYEHLEPNIHIFATDAFGTVYGIGSYDTVVIFWPETGDVEELGITEGEFYGLIAADPDNTINLKLYNDSIVIHGVPALDEHFAFKIETALGGHLTVDNITIMPIKDHYRFMAKLALQIHDMPVGTKITNIVSERE